MSQDPIRSDSPGVFVRRSDCAVYAVRGADRVDLLQRLTTNDCATLVAGANVHTILTNIKGRIIDLLTIHANDDHLVMIGHAPSAAAVIDHFARHTITEDFTIENISDRFSVITVLAESNPDSIDTSVAQSGAISISGAFFRGPGRTLIVPTADTDTLCAALLSCGMREGNGDDCDQFRTAHGIPGPGAELSEQYNPLEVGAADAVSFTKGCYLGQEVIARLHAYKKVQRMLARVTLDAPLSAPAEIFLGDKSVGELTTAIATSGLCVIRRDAFEEGRQVALRAHGVEVMGVLHPV